MGPSSECRYWWYHVCTTKHSSKYQEELCERRGGCHDSFTKYKKPIKEQEIIVIDDNDKDMAEPDVQNDESRIGNLESYFENISPPAPKPIQKKMIKVKACQNPRGKKRHKCDRRCWRLKPVYSNQ